jgi:ATP-dependent Clp endopeptidase proteolytic subunit ClpP
MRYRLRNYARSQLTANRQWFTIQNLAGVNAIHMYDEIGFWGITAQDFVDQLNPLDGPVSVYINSPGGEIFDGLTIYNALLRKQDVSIFIDGIAASAASFIAQAASPGKLAMAETARMMIHNGQAFAAGDAAELRKMAEILDGETDNIASIYAKRSGKTKEYFLNLMADETWLGSEDAVKQGLCDYVYDPRQGPSNILSRHSDFKNADSDNGWLQRDGKWVFDPDGGAADDDYQASTDTDHDYWSEDGTQLKAIPAGPPGSDKPAKPLPASSNSATPPVSADGSHAAMTGTHTHPHPAFGSQGDDDTHSHSHSHDGDADHQHSHSTNKSSDLDDAGAQSLGSLLLANFMGGK